MVRHLIPQEIKNIWDRRQRLGEQRFLDMVGEKGQGVIVIAARPEFGKKFLNNRIVYKEVMLASKLTGGSLPVYNVYKKTLFEAPRDDEKTKRMVQIAILESSERVRQRLPNVDVFIFDIEGGIFLYSDYREFLQQRGYNLTPQDQPL